MGKPYSRHGFLIKTPLFTLAFDLFLLFWVSDWGGGQHLRKKSIEVIKWPPRNAASTVSKEEKLKERTESLHEIYCN